MSDPRNAYDCYFDASYKDKIARCAYFIKHNGTIAYHKAFSINVKTSAKAEAASLHGLLYYLSTHVEDGSIINVYGDALFLFESLASKRNKNYKKIKSLIKEMKSRFDLTIKYIPRNENNIADRLTKGKPLIINNEVISSRIVVERKIVQLDEICIPASMAKSSPSENRKNNKLNYYKKHGCFKKNIKINQLGMLIDGYVSILILKEQGVREYAVDVCEKRGIKPS